MKYSQTAGVLAVMGTLTGSGMAADESQQKPNILFFSVDDLKPALECYGFEGIKTPNIDRLAARGTVMLNNHCQQAICAPSRMSMFTGLRPDTTKVWDLNTYVQDSCPSAFTMQQYFRMNGYQTAGCGKTMHGARDNFPQSWTVPYPDNRMLKYADGYPVPAHDGCYYQGEKEQEAYSRIPNDYSDWKIRFFWMKEQGAMPATEFLDVPDDAYLEGALANYSMGLLEKFADSSNPFFLTVGFIKPHLPFVAPKKYLDMYDPDQIELAPFREHAKNSPPFAYHTFGELRSYTDIPSDFSTPISDMKQKELIRAYYACVSYVDAQIGKLLDKLNELGLADNTILVLWGDHGWHLGDHGMWCKHSNFEQATRAPLIFAAPGYAGGQKAAGPTEFVDIFPTLCDLAGLEIPKTLEGDSLVPVMKDPSVKVKEYAISQYPRWGDRMGYALRNDRYRLVLWMKNNWRSTQPFDESLVDAVELYDYETDPLETVSHAQDPEYKEVLDQLKAQMLDYFKQHEK